MTPFIPLLDKKNPNQTKPSIIKEISKDDINQLPLFQYEGPTFIIYNEQMAIKACREISNERIIGFDTESKPSFKKNEKNHVALIQVATSKTVFLFRLHRMPFIPQLIELFENEHITKVGIALDDDFKELNRFKPFKAKSIVDLNVLCKEKGFKNCGARNLTAMTLGHRISKKQRISNWESARLTKSQIKYAATDAWICKEIYHRLKEVM